MEEVEIPDPFGPQGAPGIQLVVQLRIYDVLVAILRELNPEMHKEILQAHAEGLLAGVSPDFAGRFLTDELNP